MEKIFLQNQNSTGVINYGVLAVSSETLSHSTNNYEIAIVKVEYDSISNQEYATNVGTSIAEKLSSAGIISSSSYFGNYVTSFIGGSLSTTTDFLIVQINLQNDWFALRITKQNENIIYENTRIKKS